MLRREEIRLNIDEIIKRDDQENYKTQQEVEAVRNKNLRILADTFPDAITIAFDDPNQYPANITLNCYAYAFGFQFTQLFIENYFKIREFTKKEGIPASFVSFLIEKRYLQEIKTPIKNCLLLCFDDKEEVQHAAILQKDAPEENGILVCSRWGGFKAILTHKLWYMPNRYGTRIKYYHPLSTEELEKYLDEFLNTPTTEPLEDKRHIN
jgi:hypothetical protein